MDNDLAYVVWYHKHFGSTKKGLKALMHYGSYKALYKAVIDDTEETGATKNAKPGKFEAFSVIDAQKIIDTCKDNGWEIISSTSPDYPEELLEIDNYPHILFVQGDKSILNSDVKFAVVGSREAAKEAETVACNAAYNLAKTGAVIVSGAALGIDSSAHLGCIRAGGKTVGVLGCGLGSDYMKRIGDFYDTVLENGVYITEMFPYENASRFSFPERNRIISGLSRAVLVACAAEKSGSLITAETAKKQKRRVYASAPEICYSKGCEQLLKDGAYFFYNAGDIAYPFKEYYKDGIKNEL